MEIKPITQEEAIRFSSEAIKGIQNGIDQMNSEESNHSDTFDPYELGLPFPEFNEALERINANGDPYRDQINKLVSDFVQK